MPSKNLVPSTTFLNMAGRSTRPSASAAVQKVNRPAETLGCRKYSPTRTASGVSFTCVTGTRVDLWDFVFFSTGAGAAGASSGAFGSKPASTSPAASR